MWFESWYRRSLVSRRVIASVALGAYLMATIGVPVSKRAVTDSGVAFPCQGHVCGCQSAAECWDHCCCFSVAQRLVWAREHNVQPPASFMAQVDEADSVSLALAGTPAEPSRGCCDQHQHGVAANNECSHEAPGECPDHHGAAQGDDGGSGGGFFLAVGPLARQCRGLVDMWSTCGAVMPSPGAIEWRFQWVVVEWLAPAAQPLNSRDLAPPVPPPRV